MKTSEKLYGLFRQARELEDSLNELRDEVPSVEDAIKTADRLADEIFESVGKEAAYEIDNNYHQQKNKK